MDIHEAIEHFIEQQSKQMLEVDRDGTPTPEAIKRVEDEVDAIGAKFNEVLITTFDKDKGFMITKYKLK